MIYLIYDKFNVNSSYKNELTKNILIDDIFLLKNKLTGKKAINKFNEINNNKIDDNIDSKIYQVQMYFDYENNSNYTIICINDKILKKYIKEENNIPNYNFLKNLA